MGRSWLRGSAYPLKALCRIVVIGALALAAMPCTPIAAESGIGPKPDSALFWGEAASLDTQRRSLQLPVLTQPQHLLELQYCLRSR